MVAVVPEVAPGPDVNISHRLLGSTGAIIGLCIIVYGLRIATRVRPTFKLGWDDGVMTAAMVSLHGTTNVRTSTHNRRSAH